jgi:hypothetical protein
MIVLANQLREHLERRDLGSFLAAFDGVEPKDADGQDYRIVIQRLLPPVLRELLPAGRLHGQNLLRLAHLVRLNRIVLVDVELRRKINDLLPGAWYSRPSADDSPAPLLVIYDSEDAAQGAADDSASKRRSDAHRTAYTDIHMERVVISNGFTIGSFGNGPTGCTKNLCASSQEREFVRAARNYFPNLRVHPNVTMSTFINVDLLDPQLTERQHIFLRHARVDVLLCTEDEDPVGVFELDSVHHDAEDRRDNDSLKNELCAMAGLPLRRIRADATSQVRAEDFYSLLQRMGPDLECMRPAQMHPRRNYDALVPAGTRSASTAA